VLGDDHAPHAHEGIGPERGGLGQGNLHGVAVDLLGLDVLVGGDAVGGGGGVGGVLPVEHHVVGGEGFARLAPPALLELPHHGLAALGQTAVLLGGDLGGEHGGEVPVRVPGGERLVEDARAVLVFGPHGEVGIEEGGALPPQGLEGSASASPGRLV